MQPLRLQPSHLTLFLQLHQALIHCFKQGLAFNMDGGGVPLSGEVGNNLDTLGDGSNPADGINDGGLSLADQEGGNCFLGCSLA
jgi:hypothetical protein